MKVKVTTLTGDKHELEVAPHDTVKQIKKVLYESGKVTSQVRLLQGQTVLEDNRKLCDYSLPEGTTMSALFEPDVDITIEVSSGHQLYTLTLSNATSVKALKVQICGVMRCGMVPESVELKFGDVTVEDPMPLHFHGNMDGSTLEMLKPYVTVTIENNHGAEIYWRLNRKDTVRDVKVKLATVHSSAPMKFNLFHQKPDPHVATKFNIVKSDQSSFSEIRGFQDGGLSAETMRLYSVVEDQMFFELNDDKTIETYKIKDDDKLYLLSYRWTWSNCSVMVKKTGKKLQGVELEDTCLAVKIRVQDQLSIPVNELKLFKKTSMRPGVMEMKSDKAKAFDREGVVLEVTTVEELRIEHARKEEERKAQQARRIEQQRIRQAEDEARRRAKLEAEAAKVGQTVEEYLAEQARKQEEARLERERRMQAQREEQARRTGRRGFPNF